MAAAVTLYVRPGCPSCAEAELALRQLARRLPFDLHVVDVEQDEALHRRFLFEVPVVAVGDDVVARAPLDLRHLADDLRALLASGR